MGASLLIQSAVVNVIMQISKRLMGLNWASNPAYTNRLRVVLAAMSIVVAILTATITGTSIDNASLLGWVGVIVDAGYTFFLSHSLYSLVLSKV